VVRVFSVMVDLSMYVFIITISVALEGYVSSHHDILTDDRLFSGAVRVPCWGHYVAIHAPAADSEMRTVPNKRAAPNPAMTHHFQSGCLWRGVGEPER